MTWFKKKKTDAVTPVEEPSDNRIQRILDQLPQDKPRSCEHCTNVALEREFDGNAVNLRMDCRIARIPVGVRLPQDRGIVWRTWDVCERFMVCDPCRCCRHYVTTEQIIADGAGVSMHTTCELYSGLRHTCDHWEPKPEWEPYADMIKEKMKEKTP